VYWLGYQGREAKKNKIQDGRVSVLGLRKRGKKNKIRKNDREKNDSEGTC
jgi:hypothetical protein